MILTINNLEDWKAELNIIAAPHLGKYFTDCTSDEDWLADYMGEHIEDVLNTELGYQADN